MAKEKKNFIFTVWFKRNNKDRYINIISDKKENVEKEFWKDAIEGYRKDEGDNVKEKTDEEILKGLKRRYEVLSIEINNSYNI